MKELNVNGFSEINENELTEVEGGFPVAVLITVGVCAALAGIAIGYNAYKKGDETPPALPSS